MQMSENLYALKFYSESLHRNLNYISYFNPFHIYRMHAFLFKSCKECNHVTLASSIKSNIIVWSEKKCSHVI